MIKYLIILSLNITFLYSQLEAKLIAKDFDQPLYIANYPGNNDMLLIVEQDGIINIVDNKQKSKIKDQIFDCEEMTTKEFMENLNV